MADKIVSRPATDKYREEYDRIFKKVPADHHDRKLPQGVDQGTLSDRSRKENGGPQYGVVQSYNWRGPKSRATRQVDGDGLGIPETGGLESDIRQPSSEDGSEPSSK